MSYRIYAGVQTDVDTWQTKACIYDPGDYSETKKLISPTLTREVGKAGSLEFTTPLGNVAHSALQKLLTVVEVQQDGKAIWQGRVMSHEQDFLMRQKVYCEGEMAYLNDSGAAPYSASNVSFSQFLDWICANHNAQVNAYKAFTPGRVEMDTPMVVPYIDGVQVVNTGYHYEDLEDGSSDRYEHYAIVDPISGKNLYYDEIFYSYSPAPLSWKLNEEQVIGDRVISRIGDNNFRVRLTVAYANGKTWNAGVNVAAASVSCATCSKDYGTYSIYDITKASESTTYKITEKNGAYSLSVSGKEYPDFSFDVKQPTYFFSESKATVTLDILQNELTDKYGGYLVVRHGTDADGKPSRYLDYLQKITEKNPQTIAFGVNMLDLDSYVKAENIATRVIAVGKNVKKHFFWTESNTLVATANDKTAQAIFGLITKVISIDGTASTKQSLQDAADEELAKHVRYLNGMTIKAVDLKDAGIDIDRIAVGKQTHIFSAQHGTDTWMLCTKLVEPLDAPDKKEFTIGTEFSSISDLQALSARKASDAYDLSRQLKGYVTST